MTEISFPDRRVIVGTRSTPFLLGASHTAYTYIAPPKPHSPRTVQLAAVAFPIVHDNLPPTGYSLVPSDPLYAAANESFYARDALVEKNNQPASGFDVTVDVDEYKYDLDAVWLILRRRITHGLSVLADGAELQLGALPNGDLPPAARCLYAVLIIYLGDCLG